jgi:non-homologous end joining protein Ku
MNFVKIDDVDPLLFYKPYYLEIRRGGESLCALARFCG